MAEISMQNLTIEATNGSNLKHIDLTLRGGQIAALCSDDSLLGETLFALLRKRGRLEEGVIQIDGQPLKKIRHPEKMLVAPTDLKLKRRWKIGRMIRKIQKKALQPISENQVEQILTQFDLKPDTVIGKLSAGQQVILKIIFALVGQPAVLLMDRQTDQLSATDTKAIWQLLRSYVQKTNALILMTSDNLSTMMTCADDIYYFNHGYLTSTRHHQPSEGIDCTITVYGTGLPIEIAENLGARMLKEAPNETRFLYPGNIQAILPLLEQSTITDIRIADATVADELMAY